MLAFYAQCVLYQQKNGIGRVCSTFDGSEVDSSTYVHIRNRTHRLRPGLRCAFSRLPTRHNVGGTGLDARDVLSGWLDSDSDSENVGFLCKLPVVHFASRAKTKTKNIL